MNQSTKSNIGRFKVTECLGTGMQGKVYLGKDPILERQVALKLITTEDDNLTYSEDVIAEARIAARISHPNVVPIYEVDLFQSSPLLVFEYIDGITLNKYIKEHGRFIEKEAISIMRQIADGIKCAHEKGIVHLDLSSNNIMIDKAGQPRIMDFGLAHVISATNKIQNSEIAMGTPRYMTPEHLTGRELTQASDVFTLGLLFYELLTGLPAFDHKEMSDIINATKNVKIDWGKLQHQAISNEVIATLRDMLQLEPANRYQSAGVLVSELDVIISMQDHEDRGSVSLDFLLRRLQRRPEFPACSHSIAEINRLTDENSDTNFNQLGAVIIRDYSLTNRIMKIANSVIFDRGNEGVKTISQAISRLGLKLVRMISNGLLLFNQADNKDNDLKDVLVASFVAGLIARHITSLKTKRLAEEAFICAMFHNLGNHLLIFYLPDEYDEIKTLIDKGEDVQQAERNILSTTTASLGMAVAEKWNFPETITNCMKRLPQGVLAAPDNSNNILFHTANYANELCGLIMSDAENMELILKISDFNDRHQNLYKNDASNLAKLVNSAAKKFSALAPSLGVNFNDSHFCQQLNQFSIKIDTIQQRVDMEVTLV